MFFKNCMKAAWLIAILAIFVFSTGMKISPATKEGRFIKQANDTPDDLYSYDLRHSVVHNCGDLATTFWNGQISRGYVSPPDFLDPETGEPLPYTTFPRDSNKIYIFGGGIWVGGIVGSDTLVSSVVDEYGWQNEFSAVDTANGSARRSGDYADDEFVIEVIDTNLDNNYNGNPLGIELTQKSFSWADSLYDNIIIVSYCINNIGHNHIEDGWVGLFLDTDIMHEATQSGFQDDCSGLLDTLLYDDDPASNVLIPYSFDNDGDGFYDNQWWDHSVRGAVSVRLLDCSFDIEHENFNWWVYTSNIQNDFGPRRLGSPENPLRLFADGNLGSPRSEEDRYYILSNPEVDYNQLETAVHDSSDGWLPPPNPGIEGDLANGYDTRFLYSFGPFNLSPGDSITFSLAVVTADKLHVNPNDFSENFDVLHPEVFQGTLDFSETMIAHRRADSIYQSGLTLPRPGPPQGMTLLEYDDSSADVLWYPSGRPDLEGYKVYIKDTLVDYDWHPLFENPISDTTYVVDIEHRGRTYFISVTLVDTLGRESGQSLPVSVMTGVPHPPVSLELQLDGIQPVLTWQPAVDTAFQVFMIYRAIWNQPYALFDSTTALSYRDIAAESGVQYGYAVSTKNDINLESETVFFGKVIPMAMDRGILFYNMNQTTYGESGPFQQQYLDRVLSTASALTPISYYHQDSGELAFKSMADYSLIILDWEKRESGFSASVIDSLKYYLSGGGKGLLIVLSAYEGSLWGGPPTMNRFGPGDVFYDIFKLDSSLNMNYSFQNGNFYGDLQACLPLNPDYALLLADTVKLANSPTVPIEGYIPMSGCLYPTDEAEKIYRYVSSNPDATYHGQTNAIRYLGDDYSFILFNFPLSLMREPAAYYVLKQALVDFGIDMSCGDARGDGRLHLGDVVTVINYLFRGGPEPADMFHADVDCSGDVNLGDAVMLINYVIEQAPLSCCQ